MKAFCLQVDWRGYMTRLHENGFPFYLALKIHLITVHNGCTVELSLSID